MRRRDFLMGIGALSLAAGLAGRITTPIFAWGNDGQEPLDIGAEPQLFLDDYCIDRIEGLSRQIQHPERLSAPVLDCERFATTQPYMSVIHDGEMNRYRLWYNRGSQVWHVDSADAVHWENMRLVWDLPRAYGCSLLDDRQRATDPAQRFKMSNWQATPQKQSTPEDDSGMWVGFSPDGFTWKGLDKPVLPMWPEGYRNDGYPGDPYGLNYVYQSVADIIDVYYDPMRKHYGAIVKQWSLRKDGFDSPRRLVAMSKSDDFVHWDPIWRIVSIDDQDKGQTEFYGMGGIHARGGLLIGFVRVLRDDLAAEPGGPVQGIGYATLATSRDGRTWTRLREPFLDRNPEPKTWDRAMTWIGAQLPVGDEVFLYYGGYATGHKGGTRQIGLARMRKDRYVALRADNKAGSLLTRFVRFQGNALTLNIKTAVGGTVRVEIQDAAGKPVPGFTLEDCPMIDGDRIDQTVTWKQGSDLSKLAGQSVRLRFELKDADLYSIRFQ